MQEPHTGGDETEGSDAAEDVASHGRRHGAYQRMEGDGDGTVPWRKMGDKETVAVFRVKKDAGGLC